jgi:lipoprotein-anchoring transpeptidase ErfK/SrfK
MPFRRRKSLVLALVAGISVLAASCASERPSIEGAATVSTSAAEPADSDTLVARARGDELIARSAPSADADPVVVLENPIASGGALVVAAVDSPDVADDEWIEVHLPIRPNGTTGWIQTAEVDLSSSPYRIEVDVSDFSLKLYDGDTEVLETPIAVGTGDTPTPYGVFYLAELLEPLTPDGPYGPFAFGLSGYSEVLETFQGGEGVIGIHGTDDASAIGSEVSHGCIRVDNDVITGLSETVPLGTPVSISL